MQNITTEKVFINSVTKLCLVITTEAVGKTNMLSVLVLFAAAIITEAGNTHQLKLGPHHQHLSGYSVRSVFIRSDNANPIRLSPALNSHGTSPIAFNSGQNGRVIASSIHYPAPINNVAIRPASTITYIPSPVVLSSTFIGPSLTGSQVSPLKVLNSVPINHAGKIFAPSINHLPPSPSTVFSPAPIGQAAIKYGLGSTHKVLNPNINNYKIVHEVQEIQEVPEKSVSYSLSEKDYQYLKRHKTEGQDSPFTPVLGVNTASPSEKHHNIHSHHDINENANSQKPLEVSNSEKVLKRSAPSNVAYQEYTQPNLINAPEPLVTKHIYFHVPQPEFEEPLPAPINLPPPRKTYNILFIKVPAQEQQNQGYLQQIQSRQPQIEDKTLIYVLSKNQELAQVVLPPQKISKPEVFFVNYQTKLGDDTDIKNTLEEESLVGEPVIERKRSLEDSQPDSKPQT